MGLAYLLSEFGWPIKLYINFICWYTNKKPATKNYHSNLLIIADVWWQKKLTVSPWWYLKIYKLYWDFIWLLEMTLKIVRSYIQWNPIREEQTPGMVCHMKLTFKALVNLIFIGKLAQRRLRCHRKWQPVQDNIWKSGGFVTHWDVVMIVTNDGSRIQQKAIRREGMGCHIKLTVKALLNLIYA